MSNIRFNKIDFNIPSVQILNIQPLKTEGGISHHLYRLFKTK